MAQENASGAHSGMARMIALWFGAGRLPWAPGTWGSLVACVFAAALVWLFGLTGLPGSWALSAATLACFFGGVWASGRYAAEIQKDDPGEVVVDEVVGQWLALLPVASNFALYPVAFLAFRLFDITKPWPIRKAERLHGGVGVMTDDIIAGVYAGAVTWLIGLWLL